MVDALMPSILPFCGGYFIRCALRNRSIVSISPQDSSLYAILQSIWARGQCKLTVTDWAGWLCSLEGGGCPPACHPSAPREATVCNSELPAYACAIHCLTALVAGSWRWLEQTGSCGKVCPAMARDQLANTVKSEDEWMGLICRWSQMLLNQLDRLLCLFMVVNTCDGYGMWMHHCAALLLDSIIESLFWTIPSMSSELGKASSSCQSCSAWYFKSITPWNLPFVPMRRNHLPLLWLSPGPSFILHQCYPKESF